MSAREQMIDCGNGVRLIRGRTMKSRDGVTLVSDHYLPPGDDPHPVVLMRQPYGRDIASTVVYAHPAWFARHGYHVVIQDVRGRGDSEGEFYPFRNEGNDGFDTVQWAASLPESNGRVAMYGFSYQAMTQYLAAAEQPPALVAIAPAMAAVDLYRGWFYSGGMFKLSSGVGWANQMLREDARRLGLEDASRDLERAWALGGHLAHHAPYDSLPALTAKGLPTYYADWVKHDLPGPYWMDLDVSAKLNQITIPALHISGWYDWYSQGSLDGFARLAREAGTPEARQQQFLLAGPWVHIPWDRRAGEDDWGPEAVFDTNQLHLKWFDHWLKGTGSFDSQPRVRAFALGSNRWHELDQWPPERGLAPTKTWYLHSAGRANSEHGNGALDQIFPRDEEERDMLVVDPEVPVGSPGPQPGPFRQNRLEAGNNLLVYTSAPLSESQHVCGEPRVHLFVRSSSGACDLVAKLVRVDPKGQAWNVCLGAARARWLFGEEAGADSVREWDFKLDGTSCAFAAGECIRLEIAGTAFPLLDRSANIPDTPAREAGPGNWRRVTHQLIHAPQFQSRLELPTLSTNA